MSYINLLSIKNYPMHRDMPGPKKSPSNGDSDEFAAVIQHAMGDGYGVRSPAAGKRFFYKPVVVSVF